MKDFPLKKILTAKVPIFPWGVKVSVIDREVRQKVHQYKAVHSVYFVNESGEYLGSIPLDEVLLEPEKKLEKSKLMKDAVAKVEDSPEKAAYLAIKHDLRDVPVVDERAKLVGVITSHSISQIIYHDARKDLLHLAGISHHKFQDNILKISVWTSFKHRLPWLMLGLAGGMLTAEVVAGFESVLEKNLVLAAYIPLMVYMADAVGTQMEAFVIRDFAIDSRLNYWGYFIKHLTCVVLIAIVMAVTLFILAWFGYQNNRIALVLSLSLFAAIVSSVFSGLLIPLGFSRLEIDPADASGPIATIIQDLLSVIVFFVIASKLLV